MGVVTPLQGRCSRGPARLRVRHRRGELQRYQDRRCDRSLCHRQDRRKTVTGMLRGGWAEGRVRSHAGRIVTVIIGLCTIELFIANSQSLKDKRQVLLSLKDRLRQKFNLSVAEIEGQDLWQKAVLALACVANDGRHVNQVLDQALNLVRSHTVVEIVQSRIELL